MLFKLIDPAEGEKKFFYDNFSEKDIGGMFNLTHLLYISAFFAAAALLIYFSRRLDAKGVYRARRISAIAVTVMEIIKVSLRIFKNQWYDSWIPLYFCSLYIFAIWFTFAKWEPLKRMGFAYITMGGIVASAFFIIYPSTSLGIFPIWHPASLHSFVYHLIMLYTGILILIKREYVPRKADALLYFIFILCASLPSIYFNETLGTNCMFLRHAFKLPILEPIINRSKYLYMAVVFLAQAVLMFWGNYFFYHVSTLIKRKDKKE